MVERWMPEEQWEKGQDALNALSEGERYAYMPVFLEGSGEFGGLICKGESCRQWPGLLHYVGCPYRKVEED